MKEMVKMVVVLTILACASGGLLAKLNEVTKEPIAQQVLKLVTGPVLDSMFADASNKPVYEDKDGRFTLNDGTQDRDIFVAKYDGDPTVIAFETSGKGYGGNVGLMVAIDMDEEKLMAVSVTTHTETPGLGGEAKDNPSFVSQFAGLGLDGPIQVTDDGGSINAMSGATITSRAVCDAATEALDVYKNLKPQLSEKLESMK
jgi:electron transport complex protein RnfG